ncbi:hypothetical protein GCM10017688_19540 [Streptomyces ramulosus]
MTQCRTAAARSRAETSQPTVVFPTPARPPMSSTSAVSMAGTLPCAGRAAQALFRGAAAFAGPPGTAEGRPARPRAGAR